MAPPTAHRPTPIWAAAALAFCTPLAPEGSAAVFTDETSFNAAILPSPYNEGFSGTVSSHLEFLGSAPLSFQGGPGNVYSYTVQASDAGDVLYGLIPQNLDEAISPGSDASALEFTLNGSNITAVGGRFYATDANGELTATGGLLPNLSIEVFLSNNTSVLSGDIVSPPAGSGLSAIPFWGYTTQSGVWIVGLTFYSGGAGTGLYATAGKIITGAVPEPQAWTVLTAVGLGLFAFQRRRTPSRS